MKSLFRWSITRSLKICIVSLLAFSPWLFAQDVISPAPNEGSTYVVKPDYRKCAFPMCGGWFLTPVNQFSHQLEDDNTAYEHSLLPPKSIYVAYIDYRRLGLTEAQIRELEARMHSEDVLLRGLLSRNGITPQNSTRLATLHTNGAWVSANKREAYGPYLRISSTGIVCITTPCPYYKAELINTAYATVFDDLNLEKAELDREQTSRAWQAIASEGLVITGVKYESEGMTGPGTGIAATKVFFSYPEKK